MRQNEVGTPVTLTLNNVSAHDLRKNRPATGTDQYLGDRYFDPYTGFRVVAGAPLTLQVCELTPGVCDGITVPVNTAATGLPTISGTAQVGETLTANTSGIADADGLSGATFSYQWVSNGGNSDADIQGAMGSTYSPATDDEGKTLKVQVSFTDDAGHDESLTSAPTDTVTGPPPVPMPGNTPATGLPVIRGKPQVGWTLWAYTSGIADADGLSDPTFTYQWLSNDGDTDTVITGATNLSYVIGAAAEDKTLKVRVSFTDDAGYNERLTSAPTDTVTLVTPQVIGICDRTPQVRDAILSRLPKDRTCQLVTDADLSSITHQLDLVNQRVTSLKAGDFEGLFNVSVLNLENNDLTTLPAGVFDGLAGVYILYLENNHLETLPAGVFEGLSSLLTVRLSSNDLETLPSGVFDGLISLRILDVRDNELNELPPDLFDGLAGLSELLLDGNKLGGLPPEIFGGLAGLELLRLDSNSLSALPGNVFQGLSDLKKLDLRINDLASLPEGLFAGLTGLKELRLDTNNGAPFTLTAELEQRGEDVSW